METIGQFANHEHNFYIHSFLWWKRNSSKLFL